MGVKLYIPTGRSLVEAQEALERLALQGIAPDQIAVGQDLAAFLSETNEGDTLWVESLACFSSLLDVLAVAGRGVAVKSLSEPWFSDLSAETLERLYDLGTFLHAARTRRGLARAATMGRRPGRVAGFRKVYTAEDFADVERVEALCASERITTSEACRRLGVSVYSYYRRRKLRQQYT